MDEIKRGRGRPTVFSPKVPPCESVALTQFGKDLLGAAAARLGVTKSNVVEELLRTHAAEVDAEVRSERRRRARRRTGADNGDTSGTTSRSELRVQPAD